MQPSDRLNVPEPVFPERRPTANKVMPFPAPTECNVPSGSTCRGRLREGAERTKAQVRLAQAAMAQRDTSVSDLCTELGIERVTLYRYVGPKGELRDYGKRVLV